MAIAAPLMVGIAVGLLAARGVWLLAGLVPLCGGFVCAYCGSRTGDIGERLVYLPASVLLVIGGLGWLAGAAFRLALEQVNPAASGPTVPAPPSLRPPR